ncbi:hypothetical protein BVY00_00420 [bacterium G20]|nr:hypothetical protein BVY00_00420 [bacterium G20]
MGPKPNLNEIKQGFVVRFDNLTEFSKRKRRKMESLLKNLAGIDESVTIVPVSEEVSSLKPERDYRDMEPLVAFAKAGQPSPPETAEQQPQV